MIDMVNNKTDRSTTDSDLPGTNSGLTVNIKSSHVKSKVFTKGQELNSSSGTILLPSTIGIPPRDGSPESRLRDPRIFWAPAISISGKNDQPLITTQYQKKERRIVEKSEQVKLNPKTATNGDLSHLTRVGNDKTKISISFLPHKIIPTRRPLSIIQKGPGPTSYQRYKGYDQIGDEYIYTRQPRVRILPLVGPKLKRERPDSDHDDKTLVEKKKLLHNVRPFWATIGTRTYDSRLPNAPVPTIHHRYNMTFDMEEKKNKIQGMTLPGPATYSVNETIRRDTCTTRGVTIAPRYREKRLALSGPGPAMVERASLDKGYKNVLRKAPAFTISARWSPYSHTYTDECSDNFV